LKQGGKRKTSSVNREKKKAYAMVRTSVDREEKDRRGRDTTGRKGGQARARTLVGRKRGVQKGTNFHLQTGRRQERARTRKGKKKKSSRDVKGRSATGRRYELSRKVGRHYPQRDG